MLTLGLRAPSIPSVVFLGTDGVSVVGEAAERRGLAHPERMAREFKRRIGDSVPLVMGELSVLAEDLYATMVRHVVDLAEEREGAAPTSITLTHPAEWGGHKLESVRRAVAGVGITGIMLITEPEAAALSYASSQRVAAGSTLAVYDLGGGTFDATVLRKADSESFAVLGNPAGLERLGGADFDQAVFGHVVESLPEVFAALDPSEPDALSGLARLRRECAEAKEALSTDADTTIGVYLPGAHEQVRLVRSEFEAMIEQDLRDTVEVLASALAAAGVEPQELSAILLIGGSSRIPLVAQLLSDEFERPLAVDADPKASIALGAAFATAALTEDPAPLADAEPAGTADAVTAQHGVTPHGFAPSSSAPHHGPEAMSTNRRLGLRVALLVGAVALIGVAGASAAGTSSPLAIFTGGTDQQAEAAEQGDTRSGAPASSTDASDDDAASAAGETPAGDDPADGSAAGEDSADAAPGGKDSEEDTPDTAERSGRTPAEKSGKDSERSRSGSAEDGEDADEATKSGGRGSSARPSSSKSPSASSEPSATEEGRPSPTPSRTPSGADGSAAVPGPTTPAPGTPTPSTPVPSTPVPGTHAAGRGRRYRHALRTRPGPHSHRPARHEHTRGGSVMTPVHPGPSALVVPHIAVARLAVEDAALHEVLLALSVGFRIPGQLPPLAHAAGEPLPALVQRARQAGFLGADARPLPEVHDAVLLAADAFDLRRMQRALLDEYFENRIPLGELAHRFAADGVRDERLVRVLEQEASASLTEDPARALELLDLALLAGADTTATAPARAEAAAAQGELDTAGRILDDYFAAPPATPFSPDVPGSGLPGFRRAVRVSSAVWAQRGMMSRAADMYRWAAEQHPGSTEPLAVVALLAAGALGGARAQARESAATASPALAAVASRLLAEGALASLDALPHHALPILIRSSDTLTASGRLLPSTESPAAFAAFVAILAGTPETARSVATKALEGHQGTGSARPRLCLIAAWAAMLQDENDAALEFIEQARSAVPSLVPRDELLMQALHVGLARRSGNTSAQVQAWQRASEALLHVSVDLFTLLPLGELLITAARLKTLETLQPHIEEAWALLERLGHPVLWSVPLRWSAVQAELLLERPARLAPHAAALVRGAVAYPLAGILAAAGKAWISVLGGNADPDLVEASARDLASVGYAWDGARLAGHAAAKAADRKDMTRLLACARDLRVTPGRGTQGLTATETPPVLEPGTHAEQQRHEPRTGTQRASARREQRSTAVDGAGPRAVLTEREREIAHFVVQGRTYREISEEVFISPRTVEHHVARIRRRLGAATRSDLLASLRVLVGEAGPRASATP
ncbi:Hsp70 family protein [Arthrobacter sp. RIT-PI-e]|uniref:Hsp70 family protein n=1 Tax=Arthrobacter sp. RIT-PI-e TaxID=1681197 RepID=UPI002E0E3CF4